MLKIKGREMQVELKQTKAEVKSESGGKKLRSP